MSQNPQTSAEETLNKCIQSPKGASQIDVWHIVGGQISIGEVKCHSERSDISSNIVQSCRGRSLEAVLWYGLVNITNGVVWNFKFVAISVDQPLLLLLSGNDFFVAGKGG